MVERVGVEEQVLRAAGKAALDGTVEQPRPDAPPDIVQRQAEEDDLVAVELEVTDQQAGMARDMDLVSRAVDQGRKRLVAHDPPLVPQPRASHAVVEIEIERSGRLFDALDRNP